MKTGGKARRLGLLLCAAGGLGACQSNPLATAPVDPASPIAKEIAAVAAADRPFPQFSDIPALPTDERPVSAWSQATAESRGAGAELTAQTAPETWSMQESESFAARARADVRDEPPSERSGGDAETFAREQRQRATPPPPPR